MQRQAPIPKCLIDAGMVGGQTEPSGKHHCDGGGSVMVHWRGAPTAVGEAIIPRRTAVVRSLRGTAERKRKYMVVGSCADILIDGDLHVAYGAQPYCWSAAARACLALPGCWPGSRQQACRDLSVKIFRVLKARNHPATALAPRRYTASLRQAASRQAPMPA